MGKHLQVKQTIENTFTQFLMDSVKVGNAFIVNQFSWLALKEVILAEVDKLKPEQDAT